MERAGLIWWMFMELCLNGKKKREPFPCEDWRRTVLLCMNFATSLHPLMSRVQVWTVGAELGK